MAKFRNPMGRKIPVGNGYYTQTISMGKLGPMLRGYVKVWYHDKVIDTALTTARARAVARKHAQLGMLNNGS